MSQLITAPTANGVDTGHARRGDAPVFAFWVLLACLLVLLLRPSDLVSGLSQLRPALLLFVLALIAAFFSGRRILLLSHATNRFALGLLIAMAFSLPFSVWPGQSFETLVIYAKQLTVFVLIINVVTRPSDIAKVLSILVVAHTVHAGIVTKAYLSGDLFLGRAFGVGEGVFSDPNDLAMSFVAMLPLTVWLLRDSRRWQGRLLWSVVLFLFLIGIIATQSRGGVVGTVVVAVLLLKDSARKVPTALAILVVALVIAVSAPPGSFDRYRTIPHYSTDESSQTRLHMWKSALRMWGDHPLTGVGPGAFPFAYGKHYLDQTASDRRWLTAHNSALQVAAEVGTAGLILWIGMIVAGFGALRRARSHWSSREEIDPGAARMIRFATTLEVALVGYLVCSMFLSRAYDWLLMIFLSLAVVCWRIAQQRLLQPTTKQVPAGA